MDVQDKKNENVGTNGENAGNRPQNVGYAKNAEIKLPILRKIQQDMKENYNKNFQEIKKVIWVLDPGYYSQMRMNMHLRLSNDTEPMDEVDDSKAEKDQFLKEIYHLKAQLENLKGKSAEIKFDKPSILGKSPADKVLINSQLSKSWFIPKIVMQKDLSKPITAQYLSKNEKDQFLKQITSLESKLASQVIRSCQKEYHELRTSYNALKVNFDFLNQTKRKNKVFNSLRPKVSVSEKVYTVIKTLTTNALVLNKLCFNSGQFSGFIDEHINVNSEAWNATEPVLGMRFEHPEQLKLCRCARYNTIKREKELFSTKSDDKEQKQGRKKSFKVNKVTTRSRAKTSEDTSKSPQTTCKSPMKAGNSGEGCSKSPKHWMVILSDFQEPDVRNGHEAYGVNIHLKTQVDGGRGQRRGRGGRGEWSGGSGESNAAMGEGSDGMGQRAGGRAQRGGTQESVVANLSDMGEIGFKLGDFKAEDNHMSIADGNADLGITCAQPIASVSPSVDKGKQVAEPSEEASPKP
ncbi:hypothetical protein Tco_1195796 [Tanacetum coccineum]